MSELPSEIADLLRPFDGIGPSRILELSFDKGARLFRQGDAPAFMFYVLAGEVRLVRGSAAGVEIIFQRARSGFLAEASVDQPAYHCEGVAATAAEVLAIPLPTFKAALRSPDFQALWFRHLTHELRRMRSQSERLTLRTARERIIHFIEAEGRNGSITLGRTKKVWAAEMGLSHEALYRTLRSMSEDGVIHVAGPRVSLNER